MVGVDGMTFDIIDPLVAKGQLPNVAKLLARGTRAVLHSEEPMRSPALWTTIATGQPRDVHKIYDFVTDSAYWPKDLRQPNQALVTSDMRAAPALWQMATQAKRKSLVVGWLNTWPAEAIHGVMFAPYVALNERRQTSIKGRIYREADAQAFPKELFEEALPMIMATDQVPPKRLTNLVSEPPEDSELYTAIPLLKRYLYTARWSIASTLTNVRIIEQTRARHGPFDLVMTYFDGADTLAHRFWIMRESLSDIEARLSAHGIDPKYAKELKDRFGKVLDGYYRLVDEMLGRLMAAMGPNTTVILVSDHGWGPSPGAKAHHDSVPFDGEHRLDGVFIAAGPTIKHTTVSPLSLYEVTPTILYLMGLQIPEKLPGRVAEEIIRKKHLSAIPPTFTNQGLPPPPSETQTRHVKAPHSDDELERLRSLGYVD